VGIVTHAPGGSVTSQEQAATARQAGGRPGAGWPAYAACLVLGRGRRPFTSGLAGPGLISS
jgi:hypothetical protein